MQVRNGLSQRIPFPVRYIWNLFWVSILVFTCFRVVLVYVDYGQLREVNNKPGWLLRAFWMGFRFDALVTCFLLVPLFPFFIISEFMGLSRLRINRSGFIYCLIIFFLPFFIC